MNNLGFQIFQKEVKLSSEIINEFKNYPVANVSDSMNRMFASGSSIRPIAPLTRTISGSALTVNTRPGDNLMVHHAIDIAEVGDIIVVDAGGDMTNAIMGEIMAALAIKKGVAAIIINGAIRDAHEIIKMGLPVFCKGITHRGPYKDGPGVINADISLSGMNIAPGDLIVADNDGFLSIPHSDAEEILGKTVKKFQSEQEELAAIEKGTLDRSWVISTLISKGCKI